MSVPTSIPESDSAAASSALPSAPVTQSWSPGLFPSLIACVAGGLAGATIIQAIDPFFAFANLPELGISPPPELVKKYNDAQVAFWSNNYALDFGLLGICIGASVGLIATSERRFLSALAGGVGGLIGGAVAGYVLGTFVAKAIIASADQSLVQSTGFHFAIWASMLTTTLCMVGMIQGRPARVLEYIPVGIVVGLAASVVYNVASSLMFANANLLKLIPESNSTRIYWILICSVVLGLGLHLGLRSRTR